MMICHHHFPPTALQLWLFTLLPPHCVRDPASPVWVLMCRASCCWRTLQRPPSKREQRGGAGDARGGERVGGASKVDSLHRFHMLQHPGGNS